MTSRQVSAVSNMIYDGKSIVKRQGFSNRPATQSSTSRLLCLSDFSTRDGTIWRIAIMADGKAYYWTNDAWAAISGATGLNSSAVWSTVDGKISGADVLFLTNYSDVPKKWTTIVPVTVNSCDSVDNWTASGAEAEVLNAAVKVEGSYSLDLGGPDAASQVDAMDATTGWTATAASVTTVASTIFYKEGSASVYFYAALTDCGMYKTYSTFNATGKHLYCWFRITSPGFTNFNTLDVRLYSGAGTSNYKTKSYTRSDFEAATWRIIGGDVATWGTETGTFDITDIRRIDFRINKATTELNPFCFVDNIFLFTPDSSFSYTNASVTADASGANNDCYVSVYINDTDDLDATTAVTILIGNDTTTNYYDKAYARSALVDGWNTLGGDLATAWTSHGGSLNPATLDNIKITFTADKYMPLGDLKMDYWRISSGGVPAWDTLGGTPPRAKYIQEFHSYMFLLNCQHNSSADTYYPARAYRSDYQDPETWGVNNWYDFGSDDGQEITGAAVANDRMVVFKAKGIQELRFTESSSVPFAKREVDQSFGAFHRTVQSTGSGVVFAYWGGVYYYQPGGGAVLLSENISNTYKEKVVASQKTGALHSIYIPDLHQYWLACGSSTENDTILIFDFKYQAWTTFTSDIPNFDIVCMSVSNDNGVYVPWIGLSDGHSISYGEHYTDTAKTACDRQQDNTAVDITASVATHYITLNSPSLHKRLYEVVTAGTAESSCSITLSVYPDGRAASSVGTIDLYDANNTATKNRARPGSAHGRMFRLHYTETGGSSADTRWKINSIGVDINVEGMGGTS